MSKTIIGLIGASAPGGSSHGNTHEWFLIIHCAAWHYAEGPVIEQKLRLEMPVSEDQLRDYMNRLKAYQIIEVEVSEDESEHLKRISKITRGNISDPGLEAIAARLQKPVTFDSDVFGTLRYDRRYELYHGSIDWCDQTVDLRLGCSHPDQPDTAALEIATVLFRDQKRWDDRVREYAVEQLLGLKNNTWREDDEEPVTKEEFISRMRLLLIHIEEGGKFSFEFDDDDLFFGHHILVGGTLTEGLTSAEI